MTRERQRSPNVDRSAKTRIAKIPDIVWAPIVSSFLIILSGVLGWERERSGKAAGLRTHMLVGMGATLFVVLGELFIFRFQGHAQNMQFDPTRIIEAVVAGVSFLGAGTIFVSRDRDRVRGLTTAASIWVTAALGMVVGLERYRLAIGSTLLTFVVLHTLNWLEKD